MQSGLKASSTGKERDAESGNDYFKARYYSSAMGRFMSPDWSAKYEPVPYAKLDNPQTLNLYAYVGNNPLTKVDADGHAAAGSGCHQGKAACDAAIQKSNAAFDKNAKQLGSDVAKLAKSAKVSVEAGLGEEKKVTVAGVKGEVGGSVHMKSTFALGDLRRVAQVPGGKSEFSHKRWVPRVPRLWAPGIAIRCRLRGHHTYSPS